LTRLSPTCTLSFFFFIIPRPPTSPLFPYTTLFRSDMVLAVVNGEPVFAKYTLSAPRKAVLQPLNPDWPSVTLDDNARLVGVMTEDRKSTRLNSSHVKISYAVFCLKKKKNSIVQKKR